MRGLFPALAALAVAAPAAQAATLAVPACLPSGEPTRVTGRGFPPGGAVQLVRDGTVVATPTADAAGAFRVAVDVLPVDDARAVAFTATSGAVRAEATATAVLPFGEVRPDRGFTGRRVALRFRGLPEGRPAYVHVRRRTRTIATYRLTRAVDGCGPQVARGRFLRELPDTEPKANLVVNGSRRDAKRRPAARLKVPVGGKAVGLEVRTGYFSFVSANWLAAG